VDGEEEEQFDEDDQAIYEQVMQAQQKGHSPDQYGEQQVVDSDEQEELQSRV